MNFDVEVVLVYPDRALVRTVAATTDDSLASVVRRSGLLESIPEAQVSRLAFGVFGELRLSDDHVRPGERVEIYRSLLTDPKLARRQRANRSLRIDDVRDVRDDDFLDSE